MRNSEHENINSFFFDFGGVLAEEGFREGLREIGARSGKDPDEFFTAAAEAVYSSGYVTGKGTETDFWNLVRASTGVDGSDDWMRFEIMSRFIIRTEMISLVKVLRTKGLKLYILSDQTDWLDELDNRYDFFREFDDVFNSYYLGKGKRDPTLFSDILGMLDLKPEQALFIDDNQGNIQRARTQGWRAIYFESREELTRELKERGLID
jgi:putative hydrolase of the HAD superfamily